MTIVVETYHAQDGRKGHIYMEKDSKQYYTTVYTSDSIILQHGAYLSKYSARSALKRQGLEKDQEGAKEKRKREEKDQMQIYNTYLNGDTMNFGGMEWIIDGQCGRWNYPGSYPKEYCERLYKQGISWQSILILAKKENDNYKKGND